jgi:pyocin large subunit-like protein
VPASAGWASAALLHHKFRKHGSEFGARSAAQYDGLARTFLYGPLGPRTYEVGRVRDQRTLRYNPDTNEFGVLAPDGRIETYFKPDPVVHGYPSNVDYFLSLCLK